MHSVPVRVSRTAPRWLSRVLFTATLLVAWVVAGPAYARTLAQLARPVSALPAGELSSSALAPPMSLRHEEAPAPAAMARAPLCDLRCATTFAPAPQLQDEEVSLSLADDDDAPQLDAARMVPGGDAPTADAAHDDACLLTAQSVLPARPAGWLSRAFDAAATGPHGVRAGVERPPR